MNFPNLLSKSITYPSNFVPSSPSNSLGTSTVIFGSTIFFFFFFLFLASSSYYYYSYCCFTSSIAYYNFTYSYSIASFCLFSSIFYQNSSIFSFFSSSFYSITGNSSFSSNGYSPSNGRYSVYSSNTFPFAYSPSPKSSYIRSQSICSFYSLISFRSFSYNEFPIKSPAIEIGSPIILIWEILRIGCSSNFSNSPSSIFLKFFNIWSCMAYLF